MRLCGLDERLERTFRLLRARICASRPNATTAVGVSLPFLVFFGRAPCVSPSDRSVSRLATLLAPAHTHRDDTAGRQTAHTREAFDGLCKGCSCAERLRDLAAQSLISSAAIMAMSRGGGYPCPGLRADGCVDAVRGAAVLESSCERDRDVGISLPPADPTARCRSRVGTRRRSFSCCSSSRPSSIRSFRRCSASAFVFIQRAAARADAPRPIQAPADRPAIIGLIHTFFIRMGDILATYAVIGFALLPFLRHDDRTVLRWAGDVFSDRSLCADGGGGLGRVTTAAGSETGGAPRTPLMDAAQGFSTGGYVDIVKGNVIFTGAQVVRASCDVLSARLRDVPA